MTAVLDRMSEHQFRVLLFVCHVGGGVVGAFLGVGLGMMLGLGR